MKPQQQHRADQLEELLSSYSDQHVPAHMRPVVSDGVDPEVHEMAMVAQYLQASSSLVPDPVFVQHLERKVLAHSVRHMQTKVAQDEWHWFSRLVKGKALVAAIVGAVLLGGMGIALAATPAGHTLVQNIVGVHATVSPTQESHQKDAHPATATAAANKHGQNGNAPACAGLPAAQQLATKFSLSAASNGSAMQVICALHDASFQGTVDGKRVTTHQALGYEEIDQLLTYAQSLAAKKGEKLTTSNVQMYVATALNTCGSTSVALCTNSHPAGSGQGNSRKPTNTPTPSANGRPTSTPTPHATGKPISTSTPPAQK
ncbi:hypothetical protein ccbrp13_47060 [Ktedonobacteria bacterium brp13]|nr:hypothetical protein ccbrp13_47060 [Ktedonobacteria bacterium brp13]